VTDSHLEQAAHELAEAGRQLHARGWVPATSGNFSIRLPDDRIAITVSGKHKGRLTPEDIMLVDPDGRALDHRKPSAETLLHTSIYRAFPDVSAILHPHSLNASLASRLFVESIVIENCELLKALEGIATHAARVSIPIFANDQNIPLLAARVDAYINEHPDIKAYIIADHGFYTWGTTMQDALRHVEALEFLFDLEIRWHGVKRA
jgi:methylthioribulose-1-phosphate dehydratase